MGRVGTPPRNHWDARGTRRDASHVFEMYASLHPSLVRPASEMSVIRYYSNSQSRKPTGTPVDPLVSMTMPFEPGRSGNPSGRPRGAAGLARYIREQTDDFHRLVDLTIEIACDPTTRKADRINALAILFDRGLGKPHASSSVAVTASAVALPAGWDSMTNGERLAWADHLRQRALAGATVGLLDDGSDE